MNEPAAREWLKKAWHNISGARLFYDQDHYTDVTAVEIHYGVEKVLKALIAAKNIKIPKTHDIYTLYLQITYHLGLEDDFDIMDQITRYHIEASYPAPQRVLPSNEEIKIALEFSEDLFYQVCSLLNIKPEKLK